MLRSYFDTQLMLAESRGKVIRDFRQFWMGHKGDIEAQYTTNKGRLPETVVEEMRRAYQRSQEYLETTKVELPSIKEELKYQVALGVGFKPKEIEEMGLASMNDQEFQAKVWEKLAQTKNSARSSPIEQKTKSSKVQQKIVPLDELENHLAHGWEFVASLPNGKAVIKFGVF